MNFSKSSNPNAKKAVVRKTTVRIPVTKPANTSPSSGQPVVAPARPRDPNRFKLSDRSGTSPAASRKPPAPVQRALASSRGVKRKSATPQPALFSSDDEDYSSEIGSDSDVSHKRIKSSVSSLASSGLRRGLVCEEAFGAEARYGIIHGMNVTSGEYASKYRNPWSDDFFDCVRLQYPSRGKPEKFELKWPKNEAEDYKPMEDITETIKTICQFYFPDHLYQKYASEDEGYPRQFNRAWQHQDMDEFKDIVKSFNGVLKGLIDDGTIKKELARQGTIHLDWVRRILDQIYARTVSPKVESLKAYENGTDNVYGELLPRFVSTIFEQTRVNHEQIFVDLGSGVGNVVLQAALEIGCESWGIEMMNNPCDLADRQAKEFPARTRLWGLSVGEVHLLRGDFTNSRQISEILKRADVVLVNNQAFTPGLNDKLRDMFLDLKNGCQVVSLKPFVPEGHKITMRNIDSVANLFEQTRYEYFSGSVSWTDRSGYYYIAKKDPRPLEEFMRQNVSRR